MEREKFASRLGFILISAGCAIGLGNVWRFPFITGKYGGAAFVLVYLVFLVILGLPIMVMEFAVGRASQKSAALSFNVLEPKGTKWHLYRYGAMAGNYLLMMFYTTVGGWMLAYVCKMFLGEFQGMDSGAVTSVFFDMLAQPGPMIGWMLVVTLLGFGICSLGLQKGVERITKVMMTWSCSCSCWYWWFVASRWVGRWRACGSIWCPTSTICSTTPRAASFWARPSTTP